MLSQCGGPRCDQRWWGDGAARNRNQLARSASQYVRLISRLPACLEGSACSACRQTASRKACMGYLARHRQRLWINANNRSVSGHGQLCISLLDRTGHSSDQSSINGRASVVLGRASAGRLTQARSRSGTDAACSVRSRPRRFGDPCPARAGLPLAPGPGDRQRGHAGRASRLLADACRTRQPQPIEPRPETVAAWRGGWRRCIMDAGRPAASLRGRRCAGRHCCICTLRSQSYPLLRRDPSHTRFYAAQWYFDPLLYPVGAQVPSADYVALVFEKYALTVAQCLNTVAGLHHTHTA